MPAMAALSDVLREIAQADLDKAQTTLLQKHAIEHAMDRSTKRNCNDLEAMYSMLSIKTGMKVRRPTFAVAVMRTLKLEEFVPRFSKLTSRRRQEAHPDPGLLAEFEATINSLPAHIVEQGVGKFRAGEPSKSPGSEPETEPGKAAGQHSISGESDGDAVTEGDAVEASHTEGDDVLEQTQEAPPALPQRATLSAGTSSISELVPAPTATKGKKKKTRRNNDDDLLDAAVDMVQLEKAGPDAWMQRLEELQAQVAASGSTPDVRSTLEVLRGLIEGAALQRTA